MKNSIALCVVGDNVVQQSFASIDHKAVGNKTLEVINLSRLRNYEECHVLYVSDLKQNILLQVFIEIKNVRCWPSEKATILPYKAAWLAWKM